MNPYEVEVVDELPFNSSVVAVDIDSIVLLVGEDVTEGFVGFGVEMATGADTGGGVGLFVLRVGLLVGAL
jgi:hypothetical protein